MELTLEQKIGQLMMIGWQSDKHEDIVELIKNYHFGNFILFSRNIKSAKQIKEVTKKIQEAALKYNGVPAFIAIDQEGGSVNRFHDTITDVPGHMAIGAASSYDEFSSYKIGKIIGDELKYLGINCNFAPVADVNSNQKTPIIGTRSFSDDPYMVSKLAEQFARGLEEHKVLACYKHFIGHGNVTVDTYLDLPHLNTTFERLKSVELIPYLNPHYKPSAIMTAHILYNQIDDRFPTTLSRKIIHDVLREEMKYDGLVISGCLEMQAISRAFALEEAGVFAIKATVDLLLVSHSFGRQMKVRNGIIRALKEEDISLKEIDERVNNVLKFKEKYTKKDKEKLIDFKNNQKISDEISLNSVTLVSGTPFKIDDNTVVIGVSNNINTKVEDKYLENDIAKAIGKEFNISYKSIDNRNFNINKITLFAKDKKVILALRDSHLTLIQKVLYAQLRQTNKEIMLISLRTPYDVLGQESPNCHYAIYEHTKQSINSLIKILKGVPPKGVTPVNLISNEIEEDSKEINNQLVRKALEYLNENYSKQITLDDLANEISVSKEHLSRLIKKETNQNFSDHLTMLRLHYARHYLKTSTLRVYEIALLVGFPDANYFSKKFRKIVGITPNEFRNQI